MSAARFAPASLRRRLAGRSIPVATVLLGGLAVVLYAWALLRGTFRPGSTAGLTFGISAAVMLLVVMIYSIRRGMTAVRRLGPTQVYLQVHIWGGLLFLLLLLLHTGFGLPSGVLATTLWVVSLWVVLSGLAGLALQRSIPRVLVPAASFEIHLRRIPELVGELRGRAEAVAARGGPRVAAFYERQWAGDMAEPRMVTTQLFRVRNHAPNEGPVAILRRTLPEDGVATLDELQALHETKWEMDVHYTLQRILRGWLYLHLPVSIALLGLVALHIFFILYF
jgi:hypothetical protein